MTELGPITEAEKLREERDAALERVAELEVEGSPIARIRELDILQASTVLRFDETFRYSWDHGWEELHTTSDTGGGSHYGGAFHPDDGFCVGNPCTYCGAATYEP